MVTIKYILFKVLLNEIKIFLIQLSKLFHSLGPVFDK